MKYTTVRVAVAALTALASLGVGSAAVASFAPPLRLNAVAFYAKVDLLGRQISGFKAKFTQVNGRPAPGLPIRFVVSGEQYLLCEATTDTNGYAECRVGPLPSGISAIKLVLSGYDATFDGGRWYAPASAHNTVGLAY
ncbi:hypothetical protein AB0M02_15225 [Actinoplanes sp. NPDC051861]|uniref:hypothetical protein n=1 Tax=Actinoplanes sp. NPDC051861 TaxID=3155170 RepID=UPI00342DCEFD